ncbi:MAG TPA: prepilin-type N-terminal cleavage/methylation domain-containing protein [Verrucomicrobiota bacterium]|nr:prepilin-type N-terminal cleavage/methylation domain-containing protein [Verrucomicrobiota bacterium]
MGTRTKLGQTDGVSSRRLLRNRGRAAFTLIELVISTALMALVLTAAYACLNAGIAGQKLVGPRTDIFQTARVTLGLLSADLRCACPLPKGAPFLGERRLIGDVSADNLDFATHNYTPRRPGEGDFCETSIFLDKDPRSGSLSLFRRRNPTLAFDPLSGGVREELATGVAGLRFEYYDGLDWYDSWGDPKAGSTKSEMATPKPNYVGMPDAVRITLLFGAKPTPREASMETEPPPEPPMAFQTIVRLNVPVVGSSSSSGSSAPSAPAEPAPDSPQ